MPSRPPPTIDARQPHLFGLDETAELVASVANGAAVPGRPTGRRMLANAPERARKLVRLRLMGMSSAHIERVCRVDRRTVQAVEDELRRLGKLPGLKEELADELAEVALSGTRSLRAAIAEGSIPANILPVAVGVAMDKRAALLGEASATIALEVRGRIELEPVSRLRAAVEAARSPAPALEAGPVEYQSNGAETQVVEVQALVGSDTPSDAAPDAAGPTGPAPPG